MYGKISAVLVAIAYLIPPFLFLFREKISSLILKSLLKTGYIKIDDMPVPAHNMTKYFIFLIALSALSALAAIIMGHYSKSIPEDNGSWLSFVIGLGYIYFTFVLIIYLLFKNFSMSGYR